MELEKIYSVNKSHLVKLDYYLNYELSSSALFVIALFNVMFLPIIMLVALIFTPYLLFVLYKERRTGWIIGFFIMVILPYALMQIFISGYAAIIASSIPLGLFYLYCFALKMSTREWVTAENARNELAYKRKIKQMNEDIFNSRYNKPS